ncbi:MAG: hypothetical protein PHV02_03265 [Rhodocyclaceae bacterium]|nr:hypothetical protein [Rhodocyclaceae bacterium]
MQKKYDNRAIAAELAATALGQAYYGNALYVAVDMPGLSEDERLCLKRWLDGGQNRGDGFRLQDISIKIAKGIR